MPRAHDPKSAGAAPAAAVDHAKRAEKALASRGGGIPLPPVLRHLGYLRVRKDQDVDWFWPAGLRRAGADAAAEAKRVPGRPPRLPVRDRGSES